MRGTRWIALGRDGDGTRAFALCGGAVTAMARRDDEAEALDALDSTGDRIVRIGAGTPEAVPCAVLSGEGNGLPVLIQDRPADVLDGWARLRVAGYLARHDSWDGVICVQAGDVSHWVHVSAGEVVSFASFLTLRLVRALGGGDTPDPEAIADAQSRPERLAGYLRQAEVACRPAATTGALVGAELAAARAYWLGQQVALIAPGGEASAHGTALAAQDVPFEAVTPDEVTADGLAALGRALGLAD